jgi:hypothetical protein
VRSFALALNGHLEPKPKFSIPGPEAFRMPMGRSPGIGVTNMDAPVFEDDVDLVNEEQIQRSI